MILTRILLLFGAVTQIAPTYQEVMCSRDQAVSACLAFMKVTGARNPIVRASRLEARLRIWTIRVGSVDDAWNFIVDRQGEVISARSLKLEQALAAKSNASPLAFTNLSKKSLDLVKALASGQKVVMDRTRQSPHNAAVVTHQLNLVVHGYEVDGYGCSVQWGTRSGELLAYAGKWRAPMPSMMPEKIIPVGKIIANHNLAKASHAALKWFDLGDDRLTLCWRIRYRNNEELYDAGSGKKLYTNLYR